MIDDDGYRLNVGIIICNNHGQVFWAKRYGQHSWQFPQGGMDEGETPEQTMYRELHEEVGLTKQDVQIIGVSRHWLKYKLPKRLVRWDSKPVCIGQKQKWFLLRMKCQASQVNLKQGRLPEFDDWRWVSFWYPVRQVVSFKRDVYRRAMKEFAPLAMPFKEMKFNLEDENCYPQKYSSVNLNRVTKGSKTSSLPDKSGSFRNKSKQTGSFKQHAKKRRF